MAARLFRPILAGANWRDRLIACTGAGIGIAGTAWIGSLLGFGSALPFIVAPIGASAVLVFAVPASPLAQPWPLLGGNVISAMIGVACARLFPEPHLAAGLAVGVAMVVMSLLRCLHPPGGAAALVAVVGGPAIAAAGYAFPLTLMLLNSLALLATGWLFHRFSGHPYPHRPAPMAPTPRAFRRADIETALAELGETFDIAPGDLEQLLQRAESHAMKRR